MENKKSIEEEFEELTKIWNQFLEMMKNNWIFDPWLRNKTCQDLIEELRSEIYEFEIETNIQNKNKEMGDILWDVFNLMYVYCKENNVSTSTPLKEIIEKMKKRKPYIFEKRFVNLEEAKRIWIETKKQEENEK
ncbi:MAG: MazG nucleotide pyrophosphohydrolase domain-containing protein [Candidatus Woesearchaeota archaeon]